MPLEIVVNQNPKTLASAISSSGATSMTLSDVTGLPLSGNVRVRIDSEIIVATLNGTTTLTIARGQEATTAATHASGATVNFVLTAQALNNIRNEQNDYGVHSSRGTYGAAGRYYKDSDGLTMSRDDASQWVDFGWTPVKVKPIVPGDFSGIGFSDPAATTNKHTFLRDKGGCQYLYFNSNSAGSEACGGFVKSLPGSTATSWFIEFGFQPNVGFTTSMGGICFYETSTTKFLGMSLRQSLGAYNLGQYSWNVSRSGTSASCSFNTTYSSDNFQNFDQIRFWRVEYDGSTTSYCQVYVSVDGIDWSYFTQITWTSRGFTTRPDKIGFFANFVSAVGSGTNKPGYNCYHWDDNL